EGRRLADELKDGAEAARRNLDDRVDAAVERAYRRLNLATRADVETLKARIVELEKRLKEKGESET
ncbi:MAG: phasin family protein, partial [Spirochaetaceae bacterium]|nr:phasin family protein [Spirochaetaceae bacterium]